MNSYAATNKNCVRCAEPIAHTSRFCIHCGSAQSLTDDIPGWQKWNNIKYVAIFYLFNVALCCLVKYVDAFQTLTWSFVFDGFMAAVAISFFCTNWAENKRLLRWPDFSVVKLIGYMLAAIAGSLLVSFCVTWLNHTLFSEELYYYGFYEGNKYAKELMIFSVAFMPAVFEELGFRGYLLQNLLGVSDKAQAIFITSFLFAILHFSIISLFWLIPFALFLGYVRVKENTLWYGICIHFCFNATVCVSEILRLK